MIPALICFLVLAVVGSLTIIKEFNGSALPKVNDAEGERLICYGLSFRAWSIFQLFLFPLIFSGLASFIPVDDTPKEVSGFVLSFSVLCVLLPLAVMWKTWESMRSLVVSPEGLDCRSPWKRRRFLPWSRVRELTQSWTSYIYIHADDGWKFGVLYDATGIEALHERCFQQQVPFRS